MMDRSKSTSLKFEAEYAMTRDQIWDMSLPRMCMSCRKCPNSKTISESLIARMDCLDMSPEELSAAITCKEEQINDIIYNDKPITKLFFDRLRRYLNREVNRKDWKRVKNDLK